MIDTHAHYHHRRFDSDRETVIRKIQNAGISKVIEVPISLESCREVSRLSEKYPFIYHALGIHPNQTVLLQREKTEEIACEIKAMFAQSRAVAMGEIGLDYKRITEEADRAYQREWFERLISLSLAVEKPLILHIREAAADALDILASFNRSFSGVVHCYSENREISRRYMDMGFALGIGGTLTYEASGDIRDAAKYAPADMLLLETDAPFLTPLGCEGKNDSSNLAAVVSVLAQLRGSDAEEIIRQTTKNAEVIFGI